MGVKEKGVKEKPDSERKRKGWSCYHYNDPKELTGTLVNSGELHHILFFGEPKTTSYYGLKSAFVEAITIAMANEKLPTVDNEGKEKDFASTEELEAYLIEIICAACAAHK